MPERSTGLEITLADGSKIEVSKGYSLPVQILKEASQLNLCYVVDSISSPMIVSMLWMTSVNSTIRWAKYE